MNIPIRYDPDFKPDAKRTIDLRPFFKDSDSEEDIIDATDSPSIMESLVPDKGLIVSPAVRSEERRERILEVEREERLLSKSFRRMFLEWLRDTFETAIVFLIKRFQDFSQYVNPFETKHTEEELAYLALSLPQSVRTADQVLLYFPLVSRTQRYKMLRMRRDKLAMYERVFKKNR